MKKVLVIGIKGMAGHVIYKLLSQSTDCDVYGLARNIETSERIFNLDVSDVSKLNKILSLEFDFIINCIGVLNKDAENHPDKAIWLNSYFPHLLETITQDTKTRVISLSTDCVFSGKEGNYVETDFKNGEGYYAISKSLGEIVNDKDLTIRTSIIGPELNKDGIGLYNWIINQTGEVNGYTNAYWSGITTIELAKFINKLIIGTNFPTGIIHLTNNTKISKYHLLCTIKEIFEMDNINIKEYGEYMVDKSFMSTRDDVEILSATYREMILEMKTWLVNNK